MDGTVSSKKDWRETVAGPSMSSRGDEHCCCAVLLFLILTCSHTMMFVCSLSQADPKATLSVCVEGWNSVQDCKAIP